MSHGRLTWRADDEARRDWLWSQAYIMPVGAACVAVTVGGVLDLLGPAGVAWIAGAVVFAVVLGVWAAANRRLTRRGIVSVTLAPADRPEQVTIRRADGTSVTCPVQRLSAVTVSRDEITRPYIQLRLHLDTGAESTRPGPDVMPSELMAALTAAGVEVRFVTTEEGYDRRRP